MDQITRRYKDWDLWFYHSSRQILCPARNVQQVWGWNILFHIVTVWSYFQWNPMQPSLPSRMQQPSTLSYRWLNQPPEIGLLLRIIIPCVRLNAIVLDVQSSFQSLLCTSGLSKPKVVPSSRANATPELLRAETMISFRGRISSFVHIQTVFIYKSHKDIYERELHMCI